MSEPTGAWFLGRDSTPVFSLSGGRAEKSIPVAGAGFELSCEMVLPAGSPSSLYPGEVGEAVLKLANYGKMPLVFRIKPAFGEASPIIDMTGQGFEASAEAESVSLAKCVMGNEAWYFGCLDSSSIKYVRIKIKLLGGEADLPLGFSPGPINGLAVEVDACQADEAAAKSHFGLDMRIGGGKVSLAANG
jgi:hypothetical protein